MDARSAAAAAAVTGGFQQPVRDAQALFRHIMGAFAEPGTIADLAGFVAAPPILPPAAAAFLATLADADAPVFLDAPDEGAAAWIAFQTGAAILADPETAAFAVLRSGSDPANWDRFPVGTDRYPDRAATLLLPAEALEGGRPLELAGPGIAETRAVAPLGLPAGFLAARAANAALFPRGHDLVLVAGDKLMVLPRTTRVREG